MTAARRPGLRSGPGGRQSRWWPAGLTGVGLAGFVDVIVFHAAWIGLSALILIVGVALLRGGANAERSNRMPVHGVVLPVSRVRR